MAKDGRITRDSIRDPWGARTPFAGEGRWPVRVDERTLDEPERWVQSACVLCSNGCALDIGVKDGRIVGVRGRAVDRVNRGRLGPKGLHGWIANHSADRLTTPRLKKDGRLVPVSWDEAMDAIVRRTRETLERHGAGAIGFYTTGQLMLEEYYTQATIARAGLGTNHLDGNTRLCTATAAAALIESFGADGDPGSYEDYDVCDTILLVGHNMAETQTVLFSRILDRRAGTSPPRLIVVDPRRTPTAREADLHLAPRLGTNVALLNGILHLIIRNEHVATDFVERHTTGFESLRETVAQYTPARVAAITGVPAELLERSAELIGTARALVSSCLQGVYQSMQATAAAVQVNNIHLIRGMIGRPGCTVFQMNGQPTAQNTRECGADGELAAFLNYANPQHLQLLARHWNVDPMKIAFHVPPTHVMQMMRYAEEGSLRLLWITATNPAVSLPHLDRIRKILKKDTLFTIVNDAFETETTRLADVVLPAAIWAEKTGTFTNADRTVHISHQAVDPPGEARSDFDIFLDFARRMDLRDRDGEPLIKWSTPEEAFERFKELTRGRPCDYTGLSYAKLSEGSGIQWPCNEQHPDGKARLYDDHVFRTAAEECETYGHDLITGAPYEAEEYKANDPKGRAHLKPAEYQPPPEQPDAKYPFFLTTGRRMYHFHTRTKTGRAKELAEAAPENYVELSREDAAALGVADGDVVKVTSRRGSVRARVRLADGLRAHVFMAFHYGYWDDPGHARAANELTIDGWDPVSKQPHFKYAAVRIEKA